MVASNTESIQSFTRSEIIDRLHTMKKQEESSSYQCADYLASPITNPVASQNTVDAWCRSKMVEWFFQVTDSIGFSRDTVIIATSFLDRFLSTGSAKAISVIQDRNEYQLAAMTTLYMAIKLNERRVVDTSFLSILSKGAFSPERFNQMEVDILFTLKWRLNGPTAMSFLEHYLSPFPSDIQGYDKNDIFQLAQYYIEVSAMDYSLVTQNPSNVAIAAISQAMKRLSTMQKSALLRPALLTILKELCPSHEQSIIIRQAMRKMKGYEGISTLSMRGGIKPITESLMEETDKNMTSSHSCSPRGVSN